MTLRLRPPPSLIDVAPCGCGIDYAAARRAVDALLKASFRFDILKALDPLVDADFISMTTQIADELYAISGPLEAKAVGAAIEALDVDWALLSEAQRAEVVRAANLAMKDLPSKVTPKILAKLKVRMGDVVKGTKVSMTKTFKLGVKTALDQTDKAMVDSIGSIGSWITDEYGRRVAMFELGVDGVVADGLAQGLRSADIAADLAKLGTKAAINQPTNYWRLVSMNLSNRARSYGSMRSMSEASIVNYIFLAIMDERTSLICRELHEQTFPVSVGMQKFGDLQIQSAGDYTAAEKVMPFVQQRRMADGAIQMYVEPPGMGRTVIAEALDNPRTPDTKPTTRNALGPGELAAAGVTVPPVHQACRSAIIPDI